MRKIMMITSLTAALLFAGTTAAPAITLKSDAPTVVAGATIAPLAPSVSAVQEAQPPRAEIKVDINSDDSETVWYLQPIWLAVGGLAVLVLVLLLVMAGRGGRDSTTVVK